MWSPPWHLYIFLLANLLAFYLTFYLAYLLAYVLAYLLAYLLTFCLAYLLTFFLTFFLAFYLAYLLTFYLTSFLTFFPLRSGSARCDLEFAVDVRQCPLRPGSRGWGPAVPAVPTGIWTARRRRRVRRRRRRRRRRRALLKFSNPHLAGGEKNTISYSSRSYVPWPNDALDSHELDLIGGLSSIHS